jgi:hypothetical protein
MKTNEEGVEIHHGGCDCVRVAFHIIDGEGELFGLAYDEPMAKALVRRLGKKYPTVPLSISRRSIFTFARHVDVKGRTS